MYIDVPLCIYRRYIFMYIAHAYVSSVNSNTAVQGYRVRGKTDLQLKKFFFILYLAQNE